MDDHLVYAGLLAVLALTAAGDTLGLGRLWARVPLVERFTFLKWFPSPGAAPIRCRPLLVRSARRRYGRPARRRLS